MLSGLVFNKGFVSGNFQNDPPRYAAQRMRVALKSAGITIGTKLGVKPTPVTAHRVAFVQSLPMSRARAPNGQALKQLPRGDADQGTRDAARFGRRRRSDRTAGSDSGHHVLGRRSRAAVRVRGRLRASRSQMGPASLVRTSPRRVKSSTCCAAWLARPRSSRRSIFHCRFQASTEPSPSAWGGTQASKCCHAKTGTLSNVSSPLGHLHHAGGHLVAFSILQNRVRTRRTHPEQDRRGDRSPALARRNSSLSESSSRIATSSRSAFSSFDPASSRPPRSRSFYSPNSSRVHRRSRSFRALDRASCSAVCRSSTNVLSFNGPSDDPGASPTRAAAPPRGIARSAPAPRAAASSLGDVLGKDRPDAVRLGDLLGRR